MEGDLRIGKRRKIRRLTRSCVNRNDAKLNNIEVKLAEEGGGEKEVTMGN